MSVMGANAWGKKKEEKSHRLSLLLLLCYEQQVNWSFISSAFSKVYISKLHCQVWISEPSINLWNIFPHHFFILPYYLFFPFIYIFSPPTIGISTSPSPVAPLS